MEEWPSSSPWPPPDRLVLAGRTIRPGTPNGKLSRFGESVWHLSPGHPDAHQAINGIHWGRWPAPLVLPFKTFGLAALDEPRPVTVEMGSLGEPMSVDTVSGRLGELRIFAEWMHQQGLQAINEVTDANLDRFRTHILALTTSRDRKGQLLSAVRTLWEYRAHLPTECHLTTANPWNGASGPSLAGVQARSRENKTPRIASETMEALLAWSLHMLEDIGPDILAARDELALLEARISPAQTRYLQLSAKKRVKQFLADAADTGTSLPGHRSADGSRKVNEAHLARLAGVSGITAASRRAIADAGLPISDDTYLGTITGRIDGRPWRDRPITVTELPTLILCLSAACFAIVCYLSGMRPGEALNLRHGCRQEDPVTGQLLVDGRHGKGQGRLPHTEAEEDVWGRTWVVVRPVHEAIAMLEALSASPFLFPASLVSAQERRPADEHARVSRFITRDLGIFTTWVNTEFQRPDGQPVIPPDPGRQIHPSRFRRTLAHFIVRRPRGLIAAALQYGHVATRVTLSYAGPAHTAWMEDLAIERLELIVEQSEEDWTLLEEGEQVSGPSSAEYRRRVAQARRFAGRVVNRVRNVERLLGQVDPSIHHGEGVTCVWRAETAACRTAKLDQGLPADDAPDESECRSTCQNLAYTDRDIAQLRSRLVVLETGAADPLAPHPLRDRAAAQAAQVRRVLSRHDAISEPVQEATA
ncbi:integrase [Streptomyces celluloflavus]|uniref:Integrase n=1 Tax=Streptomyces celluloflavus TaxID=58344 RepID=A0ABW7R772_9ACTN